MLRSAEVYISFFSLVATRKRKRILSLDKDGRQFGSYSLAAAIVRYLNILHMLTSPQEAENTTNAIILPFQNSSP